MVEDLCSVQLEIETSCYLTHTLVFVYCSFGVGEKAGGGGEGVHSFFAASLILLALYVWPRLFKNLTENITQNVGFEVNK